MINEMIVPGREHRETRDKMKETWGEKAWASPLSRGCPRGHQATQGGSRWGRCERWGDVDPSIQKAQGSPAA